MSAEPHVRRRAFLQTASLLAAGAAGGVAAGHPAAAAPAPGPLLRLRGEGAPGNTSGASRMTEKPQMISLCAARDSNPGPAD